MLLWHYREVHAESWHYREALGQDARVLMVIAQARIIVRRATRPGAAMMPAWRIAPPRERRTRFARSMKGLRAGD